MSNKNPFKRIYDLYTSDLSFNEIERLIKRDASEVYEFFKNDIPKETTSKNKLVRALIFMRSLFNAFLLRMSPARRIIYISTLLIFLIGYFNNLNSYVMLGFILLNVLLAFELADKLLTKDELEVARKIQAELMPNNPPQIVNYQIAAHYESAREVGGDYYDIISSPINKEQTFLFVGDISGKGMPAALYMVRVQAILNSIIKESTDLKDILINLKNSFDKKLLPEYFLTLASASVNKNGAVDICRAGHLPILYYQAKNNSIHRISPKGIGIGLKDNGVFEKTLEVEKVNMQKDDLLVLYTDGITEMMNENKQQFGMERLENIIITSADKPVTKIKSNILSALKHFEGKQTQFDDLTMIILKRVKE